MMFGCLVNFVKSQNNGIYNGSNGTGYTYTLISQAENNSIFQNGNDDGYDVEFYAIETNIGIFAGGEDDGYSFSYGLILSNSNIFNGGSDDGYVNNITSKANQNMIFSGGTADGYDLNFGEIASDNGIFAGGIDDGYHTSGISKLIWTGQQSSDWLMADNWNVLRTPLLKDHVLIPEVTANYPLLTGKIIIGKSGIHTYTCNSMNIQYLAKVIGNSNAWLENYGEIDIYGQLEFTQQSGHLIQNLWSGMINVYDLGQFNIIK